MITTIQNYDATGTYLDNSEEDAIVGGTADAITGTGSSLMTAEKWAVAGLIAIAAIYAVANWPKVSASVKGALK